MVFKLIIFMPRKQGTSKEDFISYYENNHVPLMKQISEEVGATATNPIAYKRHYTHLDSNGAAQDHGPLFPAPDFHYDAVTECAYNSKEEAFAWHEKVYGDGRLKADEAKFVDQERMRVVNVEERDGGLD